MKSILSIVLVSVLLLLCAVPAFAAENSTQNIEISHTVGSSVNGDGTLNVNMSYTIDGGYMISIPGNVAFKRNGETKTVSYSYAMSVGDVKVPGTLEVTLSSPNYKGGWQLTSPRGDTLKYSVLVDGTSVSNNGVLFECPNGTVYTKKTLSFKLIEENGKTVSYSDMLTFNVTVA